VGWEETREDQIVAAYATGDDVQVIAARFGTTAAHIEQIVAVTTQPPAPAPAFAGPVRLNPPPGWPPAPDGWLPPPGWRPDPSWPPPPPGWQLYLPIAEPVTDPIDQLRRLGELRDAGIVTEAEFAAKKAEILSRM
jgi:hypothetical protein